jgi:acyl-coenzyme A thioesterase PaaI-like protein
LIYHSPPDTSAASTLDKINVLFKLESGLNGHPHILHGGITAVLMDESMGMMVQSAIEHANSVGGMALGTGSFTKTLTVEYLAPVRTPGVVLIEVEVVERRGRGLRLVARLLQKEGSDEKVEGELVECARGEGVFVTPRVAKL